MAQAVSVKPHGLRVLEEYQNLLHNAVDNGVWLDKDYWIYNAVYVEHVDDVRPYPPPINGRSLPGFIAVSRDGLVLRISDDLSYVDIESIIKCICECD